MITPRKDQPCKRLTRPAWLLQWGRGDYTAESIAALGPLPEDSKLQWGRGDYTAERQLNQLLADQFPCFNGAAVITPRKGVVITGMPAASASLQWGRGDYTAESWLSCALCD